MEEPLDIPATKNLDEKENLKKNCFYLKSESPEFMIENACDTETGVVHKLHLDEKFILLKEYSCLNESDQFNDLRQSQICGRFPIHIDVKRDELSDTKLSVTEISSSKHSIHKFIFCKNIIKSP